MNSSKTQVNKKLKSINKQINRINRRLVNNAPVAISAKKSNAGRDYYRTTGRERISDVTALNQSFNITDVFINPANSSLFPWLSGIGKKYDLYRFKRLKFSYVPALPTSEEGNVYIGLDYNTLDPSPVTSTELCQLSHWTMNVVWKPNSLNIDLKDIDWLYTRTGPIANADYKTYDLGKLFVAVEGINYNGVAGYVEVDYDVEFKRRQPDYAQGRAPTGDTYTPMAYMKATITASQNSSSFTKSATNNTIVTMNNSNGSFTVSKSVDVLVQYGGAENTYNYSLSVNLYSSTDGTTYTALNSPGSWDLITLSPGYYYKFHNNLTQGTITLSAVLYIFDGPL